MIEKKIHHIAMIPKFKLTSFKKNCVIYDCVNLQIYSI